jgi:hypothetical protein
MLRTISVLRMPPPSLKVAQVWYTSGMAKNDTIELNQLIERAADWPEEARQELVESMLDIEARYHGVYITTKDDRAALKKSGDDISAGRFAALDDVRKVFHRFRRT